jgi:hypothetical protein
VEEINNPANAFGRVNTYITRKRERAEPSIRGRTLYVPINAWYTLDSKCAFPLISPVQRVVYNGDVALYRNSSKFATCSIPTTISHVQPDLTWSDSRCIGSCTPLSVRILGAYEYTTRTWNTDVHLMNTYRFSFQGREGEVREGRPGSRCAAAAMPCLACKVCVLRAVRRAVRWYVMLLCMALAACKAGEAVACGLLQKRCTHAFYAGRQCTKAF